MRKEIIRERMVQEIQEAKADFDFFSQSPERDKFPRKKRRARKINPYTGCMHYGPLHAGEYADGYTLAHTAACEKEKNESLNISSEDIETFRSAYSLYPSMVDCENCIDTRIFKNAEAIYRQNRFVCYPILIDKVDKMSNDIFFQGGKYDIDKNNLVRSIIGLDRFDPIESESEVLFRSEWARRLNYAQMRLERALLALDAFDNDYSYTEYKAVIIDRG